MNEKFCQSCAMPLGEDTSIYGTNTDGTQNEDYCIYCYKDGHFTDDSTMEQMIEACVPHMVEANKNMTESAARQMMQEYFPTLKRWNKEID